MPETPHFAAILNQAEKKEREYDWLTAIGTYSEALSALPAEDWLRTGEIHERIGYSLYRAAMQIESNSGFGSKCGEAIDHYVKAKSFYGKTTGAGKTARIARCDSMISYISYWLASNPVEKKGLLDECWRLTKDALAGFEKNGEVWEYGKTYNQLSVSALLRFFHEWNFQTREKTIREAAECGDRAIVCFSKNGDAYELARAYVKTATYREMLGFYFLDLDERENDYRQALDYWLKAQKLSEEAAYVELLNSGAMVALESLNWEWGTDTTIENFSTALKHGRKTRDRLVIGWAFDWLALHTLFKGEACESTDEMAKLFRKALKYAKSAKRQYSLVSYVSPLWGALWTEAPYAYYYWGLALYETNPGKKRQLLEEAAEAASDQLKRSEESGYPEILMFAHHTWGDIFLSLARMEKNQTEKKTLLEKALLHQNEAVQLIGRYVPFYYWKRGKMQTYVADIKSEISELVKDSDTKKSSLKEAVLEKEKSVTLVTKYAEFWEGKGEIPALFANLGNWQYVYGNMLNRLYELTSDSELLRKAISAFGQASQTFKKLDLSSREAECYWRMAQTCDVLGEHLRSADNFQTAADMYLKAGAKVSQLRDFYEEHASYMQAWSEIEKARHHHRRREYGISTEHFEKASEMLKSLKRWRYFASFYKGWALLERAEELSRKEQSEKALVLFKQATELFERTKSSLEASLDEIEDGQEKRLTIDVVKAADLRKGYSRARSALEEAGILHNKGEHSDSAERYEDAQNILQGIAGKETEQNRKELEALIYLCRAWQKMTMAEAKASAVMYYKAAGLFEQAQEQMADKQTCLLALANGSFCKALAAGTEFENTRNIRSYSTSKKHMEAAANYYLKAGFTSASEHVRAKQHLLDAYMYLSKAQTETQPKKRAQYYQLAERVLQASADLYSKVRHPQKGQEVDRLLESVREEKQLAISLTAALRFPAVSTLSTTFSTPTPSYERAVGLERFEQTDVQTHLTASEEAVVSEEFEVRLDLVNVAKNFGLLIRVDKVAPQGFRVANVPSQFVLENGSIDMKGKRLDALKVETIRIVLEPTEAGVAYLSPEVVYTDDQGIFKTSRVDPIKVTVRAPLEFKFKTDAARMVFDYLISVFIDDYMKRKLFKEEAGWRSLVQIAKNAGVSFRSVYGDGRRHGSGISELERRGLIETRIFTGKRGRGGMITKARISYEKETMKRYIDARVADKR